MNVRALAAAALSVGRNSFEPIFEFLERLFLSDMTLNNTNVQIDYDLDVPAEFNSGLVGKSVGAPLSLHVTAYSRNQLVAPVSTASSS